MVFMVTLGLCLGVFGGPWRVIEFSISRMIEARFWDWCIEEG